MHCKGALTNPATLCTKKPLGIPRPQFQQRNLGRGLFSIIVAGLSLINYIFMFSTMDNNIINNNNNNYIPPLPVAPSATNNSTPQTTHRDSVVSANISSSTILSPSYMKLPLPNVSLPPVSMGACCGMGHRLSRNIPTIVYAIGHSQLVHAKWDDVQWNTIFSDTENIKQGPVTEEYYENSIPANWYNSSLAQMGQVDQGVRLSNSVYTFFGEEMKMMFEMPLAQSIAKSLVDNLSPLVLSFLRPMREQYAASDLHLCAHVRAGNNETGRFQDSTWRHFDLLPTLNQTLTHMMLLAQSKSSKKVSLFAASDTEEAMSWFEKNTPAHWHFVKPAKRVPRPVAGHWFEHGNPNNTITSQLQRDEAMAEAMADVFALGDCDALFIPNYSSFSFVGIMLARARKKQVFFREGLHYVEYPGYHEGQEGDGAPSN